MKNKTGDTILHLLLILVLVVSCFLVLVYEASAYNRLVKDNQTINDSHLPYAYLMNKLRSGKEIKIEDDILIIDDDQVDVYIYLKDQSLCELTVFKGSEVNFDAGETLFRMDAFKLTKSDDDLKISYSVDGVIKELNYGGVYE